METDNRERAEEWLREHHSEGAIVTDTQSGDVGHIFASGQILWEKPNEQSKMSLLVDENNILQKMVAASMRQQRHSTGTRTFVILEVSKATYDEIHGKLRAAAYNHAFEGPLIDMHGIALEQEKEPG
jgi:hypothetical protein